MTDLRGRLSKLVAVHLGRDIDQVHDGAKLIEDLGADSLDMVEIVMEIEDDFGIEISDDIADKLYTETATFDDIGQLV